MVKNKTMEVKAIKLKIGDKVEWTSQASGHSKKKVGKIVGVIPKDNYFKEIYDVIKKKLPDHNDAFGWGLPRDHKSYLILVSYSGNSKPTLYWPLVKNLKKVEVKDDWQ